MDQTLDPSRKWLVTSLTSVSLLRQYVYLVFFVLCQILTPMSTYTSMFWLYISQKELLELVLMSLEMLFLTMSLNYVDQNETSFSWLPITSISRVFTTSC